MVTEVGRIDSGYEGEGFGFEGDLACGPGAVFCNADVGVAGPGPAGHRVRINQSSKKELFVRVSFTSAIGKVHVTALSFSIFEPS